MRAGSKISVPGNKTARTGNNRNRGSSSARSIPRIIVAPRRIPGKITARETGSQTIARGSSAAAIVATEFQMTGIAVTSDRNIPSESPGCRSRSMAATRASNIVGTGSRFWIPGPNTGRTTGTTTMMFMLITKGTATTCTIVGIQALQLPSTSICDRLRNAAYLDVL